MTVVAEDGSEDEDFEDLIQSNELESASDWTNDDETRPVCLFCELTFDDAAGVFSHCAADHDFDFNRLRKGLGLDFFGQLKLVNYIRSQVKLGKTPELNHPELFLEDSQYLKPVVQDDALLFSIEDVDDEEDAEEADDREAVLEDVVPPEYTKGELEAKIRDAAEHAKMLQTQLKQNQDTLDQYKDFISTIISQDVDSSISGSESDSSSGSSSSTQQKPPVDAHYFDSYSYNEIHETMLKDTIRTESYRDFIYDNKDVFKNKTVLDVGCGTGILSMFAAKAGASRVFAVDNSDIIEKAIANVHENGLEGVVQCYRGRIEEVRLPVEQVDIIISEWMGYALLYEAMLDSVLYARDRYLAPTGLMVPAECRLLAVPLRDETYINDKINFWNDVYGFRMSAMKPRIFDDVLVDSFPVASIPAPQPAVFKKLLLHTITVPELEFTDAQCTLQLSASRDFDRVLDGVVIYFDTYFTRSRDEVVPDGARAESFKMQSGSLGFTTGPWGPKYTHWRSAACLFNKPVEVPVDCPEIVCKFSYAKRKENNREYIIGVDVDAGAARIASQKYLMR
ncbi:S-adenosyl-L-methionine-dependent methyltransferase [Limtongia smithiae]|uniref:S-adenosyl-L-methionine-dependent methyltransferase n=1 Tax=Limtongia smithiae TaxID=1125753 RepID=UPI0034CFA273